jgi:zinc transporter ZupT
VAVTTGSLLLVFVAAVVTALATGLGALPFAFLRLERDHWLGLANAGAAGVMLGASVGMVLEGIHESVPRTAIGAGLGVLFISAVDRFLQGPGNAVVARIAHADAHRALLIVAVMTAHSAGEGLGIGSSFADSNEFGVVIAIAITIHNIPEGLAISLVLVPRGTRVVAAAGWSIFSSLPQPLLAVPSFLFVEEFRALLPAGLGFAAGAMVWMLARELVPEAIEQAPRGQVLGVGVVAFAAMFGFQLLLLG